mgnify:CR=1 FL=1|tara:strand:- start:27 stop:260 length:234 start_codon:yes stop_codon:yes gene_type:complete
MREISVITTEKCGTKHKWKVFGPKIYFIMLDGKEEVRLRYTDWCEKCCVIRERAEVFRRDFPVKEVEELPQYDLYGF